MDCLHEYFGGGACRSLALAPTEECRTLLERYRMVFRQSTGGGSVYAPLQSPPDVLRQFDESVPFAFRLTSTDVALASYTESGPNEPAAPSDSIFYFDNTIDQSDVFGSRRQLLQAPDSPLAALAVKPKIFQLNLPPTASGGALSVIEPLTGQILWQTTATTGGASLLLDLRRLPEGRYNLKLESQELLTFYLSDRRPAQQWGAISIYAGGSRQAQHLPANCRLLDENGVATPKTFTLALESRRTIWRYYVIDSTGKQDFGTYELIGTLRNSGETSAASEIIFMRRPDTVPVDGRTAWVFESQSRMPLLRSPSSDFSMTLRPNGNGRRGERAIRLPYAQSSSLVFKDATEPRQFCSEVFVYV
jgi:hypothetical protein